MNSARRIRIALLLSVVSCAACLHAYPQQTSTKSPSPVKPQSSSSAKSTSATSLGDTKPSGDTKPQKLPLRRVVLYKSGVGYFEHDGRVRGNEDIDIDLTSSQLDDVLKSLTALDLSGGRITGASYNSQDSASRQLQAMPVGVADKNSLQELLAELRGARLEVRTASGAFTGRLVSVEDVQRSDKSDDAQADTNDKKATSVIRSQISLMSDSGELRSFRLDPNTSLRFADHDL